MHAGRDVPPHDDPTAGAGGLSAWDLGILTTVVICAAAYLLGLVRLWRRAGTGQGLRWWEATAFAVGLGALVVALLSPLDTLSDVLFAAHMTQHKLLMLVAAPLMVIGRPLIAMLWLLPPGIRAAAPWRPHVTRLWRTMTFPLGILIVHGVTVWVWHVPFLFEAALASEPVHLVQHLSFFWTAALFWWALVHGRYGRMGYGLGVLFVFITATHSTILGALLTFSPRPWYPTYIATVPAHGGDALADQQLAGLLMWVPSGALFLLLGLGLFAAWLGEVERRTRGSAGRSVAARY